MSGGSSGNHWCRLLLLCRLLLYLGRNGGLLWYLGRLLLLSGLWRSYIMLLHG